MTGNTLNLRITNIFAPCSHLIEPIRLLACVLDYVWCLRQLCVAPSEWPPYSEATRSVPIQTSPNCPFPRRLISCSDSRGISHTSLVLTDRSARRGMPLWQGTTKRQQSPAARSAHSTRQRAKKSRDREREMYRGLAQHPAGDKDKLQSSTTTGSIVNIKAENQRLCFHFLEGT